MSSLYEYNMVQKHFNKINKKYDDNLIRKTLQPYEELHDIHISDKGVNYLSRKLYSLNNLFSLIIDAYVSHDNTKLEKYIKNPSDNKQLKLIFSELDNYKDELHYLLDYFKEKSFDTHKKYKLVKSSNDNYVSVQVGGFIMSDPNASTLTKIADLLQFILDIGGMVPGIGMPIDLGNALICLLRGDMSGAGMTMVSFIPVIGTLGPFIKWRAKYEKLKKFAKMSGLSGKNDQRVAKFGNWMSQNKGNMQGWMSKAKDFADKNPQMKEFAQNQAQNYIQNNPQMQQAYNQGQQAYNQGQQAYNQGQQAYKQGQQMANQNPQAKSMFGSFFG